jgi:hypothetical protein
MPAPQTHSRHLGGAGFCRVGGGFEQPTMSLDKTARGDSHPRAAIIPVAAEDNSPKDGKRSAVGRDLWAAVQADQPVWFVPRCGVKPDDREHHHAWAPAVWAPRAGPDRELGHSCLGVGLETVAVRKVVDHLGT